MAVAPSASYSFTVRLEIRNKPGMLGRVTSVIGKAGGDIGAVDLVEMTGERVLRDITIKARDSRHAHDIVDRVKSTAGVRTASGGARASPSTPAVSRGRPPTAWSP
jgi:malate dehydrogenase (oxaloacetate-decarboxylating)